MSRFIFTNRRRWEFFCLLALSVIAVVLVLYAVAAVAGFWTAFEDLEARQSDRASMRDACSGMVVDSPKDGVEVCFPRGTDLGAGIKSWKASQLAAMTEVRP